MPEKKYSYDSHPQPNFRETFYHHLELSFDSAFSQAEIIRDKGILMGL